MLMDAHGNPPIERRLFVFHGRVKFIQTTLTEDAPPAPLGQDGRPFLVQKLRT